MAKEAKTPIRPETFEQIYARLEDNVAKLEQGGLSLDDAIALYEEGMTLARACQERLDNAELRITKLKEAFAPAPRSTGVMLNDAVMEEDVEYVPADEAYEGADDVP